jgi:murein DD-endopeptidase MepM/ murein hydrolase activator NlpD
VNDIGDLYVGDGVAEKDWYGFGESVYAPGDGIVIAVENHMQDNILGKRDFDFEQAAEDLNTLMGNYVVIDHLNGEYSLLAHLKQESITVQKGAIVDQGQDIGQIGFSGSTGPWVHLHYELRTGIDMRIAKGLPAYFGDFSRYRGHRQFRIEKGHIDTGDIVESNN